jgi:hypothetical protein
MEIGIERSQDKNFTIDSFKLRSALGYVSRLFNIGCLISVVGRFWLVRAFCPVSSVSTISNHYIAILNEL